MDHRSKIGDYGQKQLREVVEKEQPPKDHLALGDGEIDLKSRLELAEKRNARCVLETKTIKALEGGY